MQTVLAKTAETHARFKDEQDALITGMSGHGRCAAAEGENALWPLCEDEVSRIVNETWRSANATTSNGAHEKLLVAVSKLAAVMLRHIDAISLDDSDKNGGGGASRRSLSTVQEAAAFTTASTEARDANQSAGPRYRDVDHNLNENPTQDDEGSFAAPLTTLLSYADMSEARISDAIEERLSNRTARFGGGLPLLRRRGRFQLCGGWHSDRGLFLLPIRSRAPAHTREHGRVKPGHSCLRRRVLPYGRGLRGRLRLAALVGVGLIGAAVAGYFYAQRAKSKPLLAPGGVSVRSVKAEEYASQVEVVGVTKD